MSCLYFYSLRLFTSSNVDPLCACSSLLIEHATEVGVRAVQRTHTGWNKTVMKTKWNNLKKAQNSSSGIPTQENWKTRSIQIVSFAQYYQNNIIMSYSLGPRFESRLRIGSSVFGERFLCSVTFPLVIWPVFGCLHTVTVLK